MFFEKGDEVEPEARVLFREVNELDYITAALFEIIVIGHIGDVHHDDKVEQIITPEICYTVEDKARE